MSRDCGVMVYGPPSPGDSEFTGDSPFCQQEVALSLLVVVLRHRKCFCRRHPPALVVFSQTMQFAEFVFLNSVHVTGSSLVCRIGQRHGSLHTCRI